MTEGATSDSPIRRMILTTSDGLRLDARVQGPDRPSTMVVWCHPHPLYGGSMFAPLMTAVADGLTKRRLGVIRFDFRGVGESEGVHDDGRAEVLDVEAAVLHAEESAPHVVIAGWSFGALVSLRYLAGARGGHAYVGVAPPIVEPDEFDSFDGRQATFLVGTRDQVVDTGLIGEVAHTIGARLELVDTDHFFLMRSHPVVDAIIEASPR